jgi:hypothetical protein
MDVQNGTVLESQKIIELNITGTTGRYCYWWEPVDELEDENNITKYNVSVGEWPETPLLNGEYLLHVHVWDALGQTLTVSREIIVSNPLIEILLNAPANNTIISETQIISLNFSAEPVEQYFSWDGEANTSTLEPIPAVEGKHTLDVWVLDEHGGWNQAHFEWMVDINDAPTIELLYPTGGEVLQGEVTFSWDGNDADNDPLKYAVYISNDNVTWMQVAQNLDREVYTIHTDDYEEGTYYVKVVASDGELSDSAYLSQPITMQHTEEYTSTETNPFDEIKNIPGFSVKVMVILTLISSWGLLVVNNHIKKNKD